MDNQLIKKIEYHTWNVCKSETVNVNVNTYLTFYHNWKMLSNESGKNFLTKGNKSSHFSFVFAKFTLKWSLKIKQMKRNLYNLHVNISSTLHTLKFILPIFLDFGRSSCIIVNSCTSPVLWSPITTQQPFSSDVWASFTMVGIFIPMLKQKSFSTAKIIPKITPYRFVKCMYSKTWL